MKIQVNNGAYDETCTVERNLTENQAKFPAIRDVIQYAEQRMISTLIVSGAKTDADIGHIPTKIGQIPKDKLVHSNGYRYRILGRIQKASVINSQVGATTADNIFQLSMKDNYLYPGMNVVFHGNQFQARVMSGPSGSPGAFIYTFQSVSTELFDFAVHVAPQPGEFTCFGSFSSYGDKSLRGYGRTHYPDEFINHMTTQRKTIGISGDANTEVLWYSFNGKKGWLFEKERQARLQFMMEDEFAKWFSPSSMRDANGNLLATSRLIDSETGEPIVQGDGIIPQIEGGNELDGSAADGQATLDDITDLMTTMEKKSNAVGGKVWYCVTGTDGYNRAQELLEDKASNTYQIHINKDGSKTPGGPDIEVGYNFNTYNVNGNQVIFVKHPMFDDEERFTERGSDGKVIQSSQMIFLDLSKVQGMPNMEIMTKGAYGINRSMVSAYLEGLTGRSGTIVSSVDAVEFNMLKQDGIFIYNTSSCGIINKRVV